MRVVYGIETLVDGAGLEVEAELERVGDEVRVTLIRAWNAFGAELDVGAWSQALRRAIEDDLRQRHEIAEAVRRVRRRQP